MPLWWFNLPDQTYSFLLKYPRRWISLVKSWPERVALEHTLLFRRPVESDSLWLHGLQHARPPYPSLSPGVCPSSCSLHWWCHPAISCSDTFFSFCPPSFPESGTFAMSHLFALGDQNFGTSVSASVLPMSIQDWFPYRLTGLISLLSKGLSRVFSRTTVQRGINSLMLYQVSQPYVTIGKTIALSIRTFVGRVMSLLFSTLSRFAIAFLQRSNRLLTSWLQSSFEVILEPKMEKAMAPHSSTLAWKIPWTEEPGRLQSMGSWIVGHDWATSLSVFTFMRWRRKWQPTPVFSPGESQGQGSLGAQSRTRLKGLSSSSRAPKEEICHYFHLFPFYLLWSDGAGCHDLRFFFLMFSFKLFHFPPSLSSRGSLVPLCFLPLRWYHPHIWGHWCFSHLSWFQRLTHPGWHFSWYAQHVV